MERCSSTPTLDKFSQDLTELARQGKLDPVIGQAQEIETVIEILSRRKKNNPVLIGEPGVGKTANVEGLAQCIVRGEVPEFLRNKRLVELNVNSLVAGTKYRDEFEERVKAILEEILAHQDELILFIDEIHTIVGAGFSRCSSPNSPLEQTVQILCGLRDRFEAHRKVRITDEAIVAAAELSDRYITGRCLPDKAIDLIDQAAARVRIQATSRPAEIQELEAQLQELERELDYAASRKLFDRAKDLEERIKETEKALAEATERWKKAVAVEVPEVRASRASPCPSSPKRNASAS